MKPLIRLIVLCVLCSGCRKSDDIQVLTGEAMGTSYRIKLVGGLNGDPGFGALLAQLDADLSTWRDDSWVSRFNRAAAGERMEMPDSVAELMHLSRELQHRSEGRFDPAIGTLIRLWGFGAWTREWRGEPTPEQIDAALQASGMRHLVIDGRMLSKTREGLMLDFSAIAKGYAVDLMARRLEAMGHRDFLIEFGGDLICKGKAPGKDGWTIDGPALKQPVVLNNQAMATSGSDHHFRNGYGHIIDPRSGKPVPVGPPDFAIASTCAEADAMATARSVANAGKGPP